MTFQAPSRITLIGTGLLGGSIGLALRQSGYKGRIIGVGRTQATLDAAVKLRCIDQGETDLPKAVRDAGLIVIATPIESIIDYLGKLAKLAGPDTVITDVGSTKQSIVVASRKLTHPLMFVGSHPMAGSENHGPQAASADLFKGKPVIMTVDDPVEYITCECVRWLWNTLGMKIHTLRPDVHDEYVAQISHLPHAVAAMLVQLANERGGMELASTGFADTTRIAAGDPEVWLEIFMDNRRAVISCLHGLSGRIRQFQDALEQNDRSVILKILREACDARRRWKNGTP